MTKVIIKPADGTGAVDLYHDSTKTFETISTGVKVVGPEGGMAEILMWADEGDDDADKFRIVIDNSAPDFYVQNYKNGSSWENSLRLIADGSAEIFHNGTKKFETAAGGTIVTGSIQVNHTGGNGLTITSPTNECNIILTNDARSWKIVNYDYSVGNDNLGFHDGTADRMIVKNNGTVQIPDGDLEIADGHGIDFASTTQAAGMSSELFDDYEEGTFTIGLTQSLTPSSADGKYIKIGTQVFASFTCTWPSTTDTNHAIVEGLPYSSFNGRTGGSLTRYSNVTNGHLVCWHQNAGTNAAGAYDMNGGSSLTHAYFSTKRMDLVMIYNTF